MRLQAIKQQRFVESLDKPLTSSMLTGGGVPKMHPLKSSGPVFKSTGLLHSLRLKKIGAPKLRLPKI